MTASGVGATAVSTSLIIAGGGFKLMNGTAYTGGGGVIDVTSQPVRQLGTYLFSGAPYDTGGVLEPAFGQTF